MEKVLLEKVKKIFEKAGEKGFLVDEVQLALEEKEIDKKIEVLQKIVDDEAGKKIRVHSSVDVYNLIFTERGNPAPAKVSANKEVLSQVDDPLAKKILELKSIYAEKKYFKVIRKFLKDGRVKFSFEFDCMSGRIYAKEPSVMSFPFSIRKCIIPESGNVFIYADYNRQELAILAIIAEEEKFLLDLKNGFDIFSWVSEETKIVREKVKLSFYAYIYGATTSSISRKTQVPEIQVKEILFSFGKMYPKMIGCINKLRMLVRNSGKAFTVLENRVYQINPLNPDQDEEVRRAVNFIIQGTAAEILWTVVLNTDRAGLNLKVTVHDSFLFEVSARDLEESKKKISEALSIPFGGALCFSLKQGMNWKSAMGKEDKIEESEVVH